MAAHHPCSRPGDTFPAASARGLPLGGFPAKPTAFRCHKALKSFLLSLGRALLQHMPTDDLGCAQVTVLGPAREDTEAATLEAVH